MEENFFFWFSTSIASYNNVLKKRKVIYLAIKQSNYWKYIQVWQYNKLLIFGKNTEFLIYNEKCTGYSTENCIILIQFYMRFFTLSENFREFNIIIDFYHL